MDPIEEQIREKFQQIPFGNEGKNVLNSNIVYSLEVDGDSAQAVLIIHKDNESLIKSTGVKVEEALKSVDGIKNVSIQIIDEEEYREAHDLDGTQQDDPTVGHGHSHHHGHNHTHGEGHHHHEPKPQAGPGPQNPNPGQPERTNYLSEYKNVILVGSGKGGVGKSTLSVNLAFALKHLGKTVSLLDADVYGPSLPMMLDARDSTPKIIGHKILPLSRLGIEFMSMGSLVPESQSMIWRGPMIHQAIEQLLRDTQWPGGDYIIIDLPPGTGDVQISLAQTTEATGAVIVCTPQDVALLDARKALNMFGKVNIPILGMIENMSSFVCPKCGHETPIFDKGGTETESKTREVPFLGHVPIELDIRLGGDKGNPVVHQDPESKSSKPIIDIAKKLIQIVEEEG